MAFMRRHLTLIGMAASCAAIGAGASAIASAGAASTSTAAKGAQARTVRGGARRVLDRAVHGDLVLATKTGFADATFDRGFVQAVTGQQLTLREGTKRATYKTLTLTIPATAHVREDRKRATLADLKQGQHVLVLQGPKQTLVVARGVRNG